MTKLALFKFVKIPENQYLKGLFYVILLSMTFKDNKIKLVAIYLYISELHESLLKYSCQRFTNNNQPEFTDAEIMTIYIFVVSELQLFKVKQIHKYTKNHLLSWFPRLGSYVAFNKRLNRLSEAFKQLGVSLISDFQPNDCILTTNLLDSMPIITCSGKRKAKVALEITDKGYNSTKDFYYYGLKLHALVS